MMDSEVLADLDHQINQIKAEQKRLAERLEELTVARQKVYDGIMIEKSESLSKENWAEKKYEWDKKIHEVLRNVFKLTGFREKQLAAINAILARQDVILLMPTGGGKSLCYQLPALVTNGLTLVVSPLISLMEDQVMGLKKLNINVEILNSNTPKESVKEIHDSLIRGSSLKLLYVTPERMAKSKRFMSCVQKCYLRNGLDRIAIDEVHCCSQWGHDFRTDYKFLGVLKSMFPEVPIIGVTATATSDIIIDVQKMLDITGCVVFKATFNRPNLYYEVRPKSSNQKECVDQLESMLKNKYKDKSGIIYTTSIKDSVDLMTDLRCRGLKVACYHAELDHHLRSKVHSKWHSGSYQAVIATVAFGMGIDKPDVRFVIHHTLPKSMENFYQESGRAGRDDKPADCILFYRLADVFRLSGMVFSTQTGLKNLYSVVDYCLSKDKCRRTLLGKYFNEVWESSSCNKMCDWCKSPREGKEIKITSFCDDLYKIIARAESIESRMTALKLLDAWFQKGDRKVHVTTLKPPCISKETASDVIAYLLVNGYLKEDFHFTAYSTISYIKKGPKASAFSNDCTIKMIIPGPSKSSSNEHQSGLKRSSSSSESVTKKPKLTVISLI